MKRAKCRMSKTPPPPSTSSTTSTPQFHPTAVPTPTPPDFHKIEQRAQVHESQLMKLAKAIPSMIQNSIKNAMQPAKDKLKSLCSTVEVLESEVIFLEKRGGCTVNLHLPATQTLLNLQRCPCSLRHPEVHRTI
ncbi:hypothetical protein HAX54_017888, partial [Datura stramonium]|nr:hypothetical protein [Datura stramonium]